MTAEKLIPNDTVQDYETWQGDWELPSATHRS